MLSRKDHLSVTLAWLAAGSDPTPCCDRGMHCKVCSQCIHPGPRKIRKRPLAVKGGRVFKAHLRQRRSGCRLSPGINPHPGIFSTSLFPPESIATQVGKGGPHRTSVFKNHMFD